MQNLSIARRGFPTSIPKILSSTRKQNRESLIARLKAGLQSERDEKM